MSAPEFESVGFIKYSGDGTTDGVIDAAAAGSALLGLDDALRFFNRQQSTDLSDVSYEIPVRTVAGSWKAIVLASVGAVVGAFALSYARKAGEKMAENDFKEIGLGDVLRRSMGAIEMLVKLIKHTRRPRGWEGGHITLGDQSPLVSILNERGEELLVPLEYLRWYQAMPPRLLIRMTSVVRADRVLTIGTREDREPAKVLPEDKPLFDEVAIEDPGDVLFPELLHGMRVRLEGRLIRGNEASNSVGLEFEGHVLNCIPEHGSIRRFKSALFLRCQVEALVTRHPKNRFVADRRPTLIVSKVVPSEEDDQRDLFDG